MRREIKIVLMITVFLFTSCGLVVQGIAAGKTTIEKGAIPPNFANKEHILLCMLEGDKKIDKYMKKHIQKYYKGNYEFVTREDLRTIDKYTDKNKYRYTFESEREHTSGQQGMGTSTYSSGPGYDVFKYGIWDRKELETYSNNFYSSFFGKLIKAYAIKMEQVRVGAK